MDACYQTISTGREEKRREEKRREEKRREEKRREEECNKHRLPLCIMIGWLVYM
jgi:hypothetical protein